MGNRKLNFLYPILFILSILFIIPTTVSASEEIGQYRIQLDACPTEQEAIDFQSKVSQSSKLSYIASLGYSTTIYILPMDGMYNVYLGDYPTFGEARYMYRMMLRDGYSGQIVKVRPSTPSLSSITGTANDLYDQAIALNNDGQYNASTVYFTAYLNQYPTDSKIDNALMELGRVKVKLDDRIGAIQAYQEVVNHGGELAAEALRKIGYNYVALYQYENAISTFSTLIKLYPTTSHASVARERISDLTTTDPKEGLYKMSVLHFTLGNFNQADEMLTSFVTQYPQDKEIPEAYMKRAYCKIQSNDTIRAFEDYKQVIQYPNHTRAKDACGELSKLALSLGSTYIDDAIEALKQSPCLDISNQELAGHFQTYIGFLNLHGKVPTTPGGKLTTGYATLSDQSACWKAIQECRKVRELYPNATRYDLARSSLMEVEGYCRFDNETTVIELAQQLIANYPDQKKPACYAQFIIGRSFENLKDYQNALQAYQTLLDNYTLADNITNADDIIAYALFRKSQCLIQLNQKEDAKSNLQEIVQNHANSSMIVWANKELNNLAENIIILTEDEMMRIFGSSQTCNDCSCGTQGCDDCLIPCDCGGNECHCNPYPNNCGPGTRPCWPNTWCQLCNCGCNTWGCKCPRYCPCPGSCEPACPSRNCTQSFLCAGQTQTPCPCGGSGCQCVICTQKPQAKPCGGSHGCACCIGGCDCPRYCIGNTACGGGPFSGNCCNCDDPPHTPYNCHIEFDDGTGATNCYDTPQNHPNCHNGDCLRNCQPQNTCFTLPVGSGGCGAADCDGCFTICGCPR